MLWAFGFANTIVLGWLAAAAAPLVIHLWSRRRYRERHWAAMDFLLAAMKKNARRLRIEQWLLLAVRTLAIVLVVLAAARPLASWNAVVSAAGQRTLKVFVIDGSYSMSYQLDGQSLFDRAKQLTRQIVVDSRQGDGFALVLMASPPNVVVGAPAMEQRDFLDELESLRVIHGGGDLSASLAKVEEICRQSAAIGLANSEVYFFSDLARNSWLPSLTDQATSDFQQRLTRLSVHGQLVVVDLGKDNAENICIADLAFDEPLVIAGRPTRIVGHVRQFGTIAANEQRVELFVDGRRAAETRVALAGANPTVFGLTHRFDAAGEHWIEARIQDDALSIDNHRYLAAPVRQAVQVLCVNGKPGPRLSGAADYVRLALQPRQDDGLSLANVEVVTESALVERDLSKVDCLFLCNVSQLTTREARLVADFVRRGGGLAILLGDQTIAERYNHELFDIEETRLLPGRLTEIITATESPLHIDPLGYRHPLMREFSGHEDAGLSQVFIKNYVRLQLKTASAVGVDSATNSNVATAVNAQLALAVESGDPLLVSSVFGRGRVVVLTTDGSLSSIDPATKTHWNRLAPNPSFPPLINEIVRWLLGAREDGRQVAVGQLLAGVFSGAGAQSLAIQTPHGRQSVRTEFDRGEVRWSFADTTQAGIYRLDVGAESDRSQRFAVNVDTSEGDLRKIDPLELPPQFSTRLHASTASDAAALTRSTGFERPMLYGALGLLLLEMILARRRLAASPKKGGARA